MRKIFSKKILIYAGLALIAGAAVFAQLGNGNGKQVATALRADIVQEVASTGKVKPNRSVDLGFDKSGRIGRVYAAVGDTVKHGDVLATLESGEALASLEKAKAFLEEENIKLREMKNTAPASYADAAKNLEAALREGFADADNAVRNRVDQFFKNIPNNPQFEIYIASGNFIHYFDVPDNIAIEINNERGQVETVLNGWQDRLSDLDSSDLATEADRALDDLDIISNFLNKVAGAVNTFTASEYSYEATVAAYKTAVSAARTDVSGAISAIVAAKDKLNSSQTVGEGGQFESVLAQEAKVKQAEADVASLQAFLNKSSIIAPFDGVVSIQDAKPGAAVSLGNTLISILSQDEMYVEADISEIHIGKIMEGNPVSITFDAFPGEVFLGQVSYVEPGDVVIDGIVNYKVRIALGELDPKIKSGLTANLKIQTARKDGVLALPLYAVSREEGGDFINKIVGEKSQKVPITLGLSGNNGMVEILSGLEEGDMVEF